MNNKYLYIGAFVNNEELYNKCTNIGSRLSKLIDSLHVTFQFKPEEINELLFGEELLIKVVGYGADKNNEGLFVEVNTNNPELKKLIDKVEVPHITLSISEKGRAVNTRFLSFKAIEPFYIKGLFGGYKYDDTVIVSP